MSSYVSLNLLTLNLMLYSSASPDPPTSLRRFTTFESAAACLLSLLLYRAYQYLAQCWRWRKSKNSSECQQPLLSDNEVMPAYSLCSHDLN